MTDNAALLRFPHGRVLLARTKLAYVHLGNLLSDAKRDRTARVSGYVAIWLPEELLLLLLSSGEVANALAVHGSGAARIAISTALGRVPPEPEFGEICFHEAPEEQLACMYRTLLGDELPWPEGFAAGDPRALFPYLRDERFDGVIQVVSRDAFNYLVLRDGLIQRTFLADAHDGGGRTEQLARLFGPPSPRPRVSVGRWAGPAAMPSQAPPSLIAAYRDVVSRLLDELASTGVPVPSAVAERVRHALLAAHPPLAHFPSGEEQADDPPHDRETVTGAVAAWMTETVREALDDDADLSARIVRNATHDRRHMLQAAGFLAALPWKLEW